MPVTSTRRGRAPCPGAVSPALDALGRVYNAHDRGNHDLVDAALAAFAQQKREVDRLCDKQGEADQQRELTREAARPEAHHRCLTSG